MDTISIGNIDWKLREVGHLRDHPRSVRPSITQNKKLYFLLSIEENPFKPAQAIALDIEIGKSSVRRILKKDKYHPYKKISIQELNEDDPDRRLKFCEFQNQQ